ncbi:MAG TPA: rod shape-determining protein RodA, partial [Luteimonas sp.]|nr:rod shape-determining protein RodA [Luteimonas sp.]
MILQWLLDLLRRFTRTLDWSLLAALVALMLVGLAVLYSAGNQAPALVVSQGARYLVGLGVMWLLSRVAPLRLRGATPVVYALSLLP